MFAFITSQSDLKCERCAKTQPPGTTLEYIKNRDPTKEGVRACPACVDHYARKAGTIRREPAPMTREITSDRNGAVAKQIAAAQRGGEQS
ncbi:hypothetical protein HGRIS_009264 [Hohenbuehelia grisea]|uniref:HNH endonuclease n=1 Tax=Hohenbuehelia grisea TaxID=104357 RepID=A0ABR3J0L6_9AGAR